MSSVPPLVGSGPALSASLPAQQQGLGLGRAQGQGLGAGAHAIPGVTGPSHFTQPTQVHLPPYQCAILFHTLMPVSYQCTTPYSNACLTTHLSAKRFLLLSFLLFPLSPLTNHLHHHHHQPPISPTNTTFPPHHLPLTITITTTISTTGGLYPTRASGGRAIRCGVRLE